MAISDYERSFFSLNNEFKLNSHDIEYAKQNGFDFNAMRLRYTDKEKIAALCKLYAYDELNGHKINFSIFNRPEIPKKAILLFITKPLCFEIPNTLDKLYNKIINLPDDKIAIDFLKNAIYADDLNLDFIFKDSYRLEHLLDKHFGTSDLEDKTRVLSEQKPGSHFTVAQSKDGKITQTVFNSLIREMLIENSDKILSWIRSRNHSLFELDGDDANEISLKFDVRNSKSNKGLNQVGIGYDLCLNQKSTSIMKMAIRKDITAPLGFVVKTIFPDVLDPRAEYTGVSVSLSEADEISKNYIIKNTIKNLKETLNREPTDIEKKEVIKNVNNFRPVSSYMDTPFYRACSKIKEYCSDKKIVVFFVNSYNSRIEVTPENHHNRRTKEYHRAVFKYNKRYNKITVAFYDVEGVKDRELTEEKQTSIFNLRNDEISIFSTIQDIIEKEFEKEKVAVPKMTRLSKDSQDLCR